MNASPVQHSTIAAPQWLEIVRTQLEKVRYGVIELVVHDGHVTLIETTEKTRLPAPRD